MKVTPLVQASFRFPEHVLQLSVGGLDCLVLILRLLARQLLVARPVHSPETFGQNWVGVVERGVEPVGVHRRQILDLQLQQRSAELLAVPEVDGKGICRKVSHVYIRSKWEEKIKRTSLVLHLARPEVHAQLEQSVCGRQNFVEQDEADHARLLPVETEVCEERAVVDEDREQGKGVEQVALSDKQKSRCMVHLPVAEFVTQDSLDLLVRALLEKCIEDDNLLLSNPWQTGEVGVAVGAALASVDDLQFREREVEPRGEGFDGILELARLERLKLVEQGDNEDRVDGHAENLDRQHEDPQVVEEVLASLPDDGEEGAAQRNAKGQTKGLTLDHVRDPGVEGHLIEAVLFLEDEVVVV